MSADGKKICPSFLSIAIFPPKSFALLEDLLFPRQREKTEFI